MPVRTTEEKLAIVKNILANPNQILGKKEINYTKWAAHYSMSRTTLREWVEKYKKYGVDGLVSNTGKAIGNHAAGRKKHDSNSLEDRLLKLEKENKKLKGANDLLKKYDSLLTSWEKRNKK